VNKIKIYGSDSIGLFGYIANDIAVLSEVISKEEEKIIKDTLGLEGIVKTTIAGTPTVGSFIIGKKDLIIVPSSIYEEELKKLEELFRVEVVDVVNNALGNNYYYWPKKNLLFAAEDTKKEAKLLAKKLNADLYLIDTDIEVGSSLIGNSKMLLHNPDIYIDIEDAKPVTLNMGDKFVGAAALLNDKGIVVGSKTTGIELIELQDLF